MTVTDQHPTATTRATPATAGGWVAFSTGSRALVVDAVTDDASVAALWSAIAHHQGLQVTLDLLTREGLSATPPFALLDWSEKSSPLRVIVRGGVTVTVLHAGGTETLSGAGVSTWVERGIDSASSATVVVAAADAADVPALPLAAGAAWVAALTVTGLTRGEATAVPAPAASVASGVTPAVPAVVAPDPEVSTPELVEIDIEATVTEAPVESPDTNTIVSADAAADDAFGDTMFRPVPTGPAPGHEPAPDQTSVETAGGDHDGHTVLTSDIAKLRGRRKPKPEFELKPAALSAPTISLVLAGGTRESLTQPILVGRSPSVSQVSGGKMPRLITVGGSDQDISRTHVRFALEGGTVVVTDLHSRNGTTVAMPGKDPQKLRAGEPTSVIVGTVVDLGGGVTFTVDED